jgi:hypothetical protein
VATVPQGDKRKAVADYVLESENGWAEWLQTHRVELNAMTTPQFIAWLDDKMEAHVGKLIPPPDVLTAELDKRLAAKSAPWSPRAFCAMRTPKIGSLKHWRRSRARTPARCGLASNTYSKMSRKPNGATTSKRPLMSCSARSRKKIPRPNEPTLKGRTPMPNEQIPSTKTTLDIATVKALTKQPHDALIGQWVNDVLTERENIMNDLQEDNADGK